MDQHNELILPPPSSRPLSAQLRESAARVVEWRPWPLQNSSLIGHCDVAFAGGWVVHGIPVFRRANGSLSVGVPSAAQLDAEGRGRWQRLVGGALAEAGIGGGA